ncbi:MAG: thioredoxin family protein [Methyloligellaceae bacterium]
MAVSRRSVLAIAAGAGLAAAVPPTVVMATGKELQVGDDGLFHQPWFHQSFLDLKDDLAEAAEAGKHFAIIWEQRGCPYCRELHRVNLAKPEISKYIQDNFVLLQLDMWGPRKVTDFDGKEMGERELAQRWRVNFTPTLCFFPNDAGAVAGKDGGKAEVVRMPGYFKPFHFLSMFEFVRGGHYKTTQFQRFLQAKAEKLRAEGKEVELW